MCLLQEIEGTAQRSRRKSKREFQKYLELSYNKSLISQNFWNTAKAMLKGKFIALTVHLSK